MKLLLSGTQYILTLVAMASGQMNSLTPRLKKDMKKILFGISVGLVIGLLAYYSLTFFSPNEFISKDFARVTIKNESGINAKRILLQHGRGSIEVTGLRDKEEIRFVFQNGNAENVYKILVTFDNDKTLASKEVYFEYGYRGTETINASEIITENNW